MSATKVTLRKREYPSGKVALYLDYYPAIRNPVTLKMTRREYLGMYLTKARTPEARLLNAEKTRQAEAVRAQREISLFNEQYGFIDKSKQKADFLAYFKALLPQHRQQWTLVYNHFSAYVNGKCSFADITVELCSGFRNHLLNAKQLRNKKKQLSKTTASGYWITFLGWLSYARQKGYLTENINKHLQQIKTEQSHRENLTVEELNQLVKTPCENEEFKRACLFSALTGLRHSDIKKLRWKEIRINNEQATLYFKQQKTKKPEYQPISQQALELCGKPKDPEQLVFNIPDIPWTAKPLKRWIESAGIKKHITFHCFRHTYATLQLASGTDIYTVSKALGHSDIKTTQIYLKVVDETKQKTTQAIKLKL